MITPAQALEYFQQEITKTDSEARHLETRIDDAIRRASVYGGFPVAVQLAGTPQQIREAVAREYTRSGWDVAIRVDWRDGYYLEIGRKV